MSDNTEPPPSLVAELRERARLSDLMAYRNAYNKAAEIAERHEARWQAREKELLFKIHVLEQAIAMRPEPERIRDADTYF